MKIKIVTDSTNYMAEAKLIEYNISKVNLTVTINGNSFLESKTTNENVMEAFNNGEKVTSSQPSPKDYADCFKKYANDYDLIVVFTLPRTLSGSGQAAILGAELAEITNVAVFPINKCAFGMENIIEMIYDDLMNCNSLQEVKDLVNLANSNGALCFKIANLMHLHNGGRLSSTAAIVGSLLHVKAIIGQHLDGSLHNDAKLRTDTKVFSYMINQIEQTTQGFERIFIKIINLNEDANVDKLFAAVKKSFPNAKITITKYLGPVFTVHLGDKGYGISVSCL